MMIRKRLNAAQLGAATLVILCGSFASYAFGHALGQRGAHNGAGAHAPARVTSIKGLLGQAIASIPAAPATAPLAPPAAPPRAPAVSSSRKHHNKDGHGKGGGDGGHKADHHAASPGGSAGVTDHKGHDGG